MSRTFPEYYMFVRGDPPEGSLVGNLMLGRDAYSPALLRRRVTPSLSAATSQNMSAHYASFFTISKVSKNEAESSHVCRWPSGRRSQTTTGGSSEPGITSQISPA